MKVKIFQVDAFTDTLFSGNPAAVCPLPDTWLDDTILQNIAFENNLAETAFYINKANNYNIRWFTPTIEVDLCGHATLAAAHVYFTYENTHFDSISFNSKSGILNVKKENDYLTMDFPTDIIKKMTMTDEIKNCFDYPPVEVYKGKTDYMLIYENEEQIKNIGYNLNNISKINARGVIITAKGNSSDFVSRFFAPQSGINEDSVTGSAHTTLTPYWSKILNKKEMTAVQLSRRKGCLICKNLNERTEISGKAKTYMIGDIIIK
jgi:PhzF family phenazine biosynthesis protein